MRATRDDAIFFLLCRIAPIDVFDTRGYFPTLTYTVRVALKLDLPGVIRTAKPGLSPRLFAKMLRLAFKRRAERCFEWVANCDKLPGSRHQIMMDLGAGFVLNVLDEHVPRCYANNLYSGLVRYAMTSKAKHMKPELRSAMKKLHERVFTLTDPW
jgi:hypothetical protein